MANDWKTKLSSILGEAEKILEENQVSEKLISAFTTVQAETDKIIKEYGISEKVTAATKNITDHIENLSGSKQNQALEEKINLQTDQIGLLAEKLDQAIKRIEVLEKSRTIN